MTDRGWRAARLPVLVGILVGVVLTLAVEALLGEFDDGSEALAHLEETTRTSAPEHERERASTTTVRPTPITRATTTTRPSPGVGGELTCPRATVEVATASELHEALAEAGPGTTIQLAPGTYRGEFVASGAGSASAPIFLCGGTDVVLEGEGIESGYVLHLQDAAFWRVVGFTVRNGQKGVMADHTTYSTIADLTVEDIGDEGIHLRAFSSHNRVVGNTVRRTGLRRDKFGEGIYVGSAVSNWSTYSGGQPDASDDNVVEGNTISETGSESIDIKEGTTGGKVVNNVMDGAGISGADSLIDVKGNDWLIEGNRGSRAPEDAAQTHHILDDWGAGNTFAANVFDVDGGGNHVYIHDPDSTGNRVLCDNRTAAGLPLRTNVSCEP